MAVVLDEAEHAERVMRWRDARVRKLTSEHGWLSIVDRRVLTEGTNELPIGRAVLRDSRIEFEAAGDKAVTLDGQPVRSAAFEPIEDKRTFVLACGSIRFEFARMRGETVRSEERRVGKECRL